MSREARARRPGVDLRLVRTQAGLRAADELTRETMRSWPLDEVITCSVRRTRNPHHHRKAFALLELLRECDRRDPAPPMRVFLLEVKLKLGLFSVVILPDGRELLDAESIAFDAMGQDKFEREFWNPLLDLACRDYLPTWSPERVAAEVNRRMEFDR